MSETTNSPTVDQRTTRFEQALDEVRDALRGLRYGEVSIVVQDGVVVQIERTERRRLPRPACEVHQHRLHGRKPKSISILKAVKVSTT